MSGPRNPTRSIVQEQTIPKAGSSRWLAPLIIALLAFVTFLPTLRNDFVDWDDTQNFLNNAHYRGLGWGELRWMFTTFHMGHYQPLSWLTFGLDYLLWGMNPFGYHLSNLLLHAANAVIFFFVALRLLSLALPDSTMLKGGRLRTAAGFAALVFAVHPLRVESVAWVTERRDVLSTLFFLWTILCYLRANSGLTDSRRRQWMTAAVILYGLSLLAKVSGVTLPIILLILDVYPLRRLGPDLKEWFKRDARGIWWEKLPFFIFAFAAGLLAAIAQYEIGSLSSIKRYGIVPRLAQAFFGLAFYIEKTLAPFSLSPLYQIPVHLNPFAWPFVLSAVAVIAGGLALFFFRRRWPSGLAAAISYAVILAPVLGIVQNGPQLVADRYSYVSCLGWALLAGAGLLYAWRYMDAQKLGKVSFRVAAGLGAAILVVLGMMSWRQTRVWHDSESLFRQMIAVSDASIFPSGTAHYALGNTFLNRGDLQMAIEQYHRALQINPFDEKIYEGLGNALARRGDSAGAAEQYRVALLINPSYDKARNNLGTLLASGGDLAGAIEQYRLALQINPMNEKAHNNLGTALASRGDLAGAIEQYRLALQINPMNEKAHNNLGKALARRGELREAIKHYQQAIFIQPLYANAIENLRQALDEERKNR